MKFCPGCSTEKSIGEFYKNAARRDGLSPYCVVCARAAEAASIKALRQRVINHLGGKCERCPFEDPRALQIDHPNGGGREDRGKNPGRGFLNRVLKSEPGQYALLCANCNVIKRMEKKEHVGDRIYHRDIPTKRIMRPKRKNLPDDRWAFKHDKCLSCDTSDNKHQGQGLCIKCYWKDRRTDK